MDTKLYDVQPRPSIHSPDRNLSKSDSSLSDLPNRTDDFKSGSTTRSQSKIKEDGGKKNTPTSDNELKAHRSDTTQTNDLNSRPTEKREENEQSKSRVIIFATVEIKEGGGKKNTPTSDNELKAHRSDTTQTNDLNSRPTEKREENEQSKSRFIIFATVGLILAIFIVRNPFSISVPSLLNDEFKMFEKVDESVTKLRQNFKNQEPETWKKLKSAVKALFRNTTKQPSVVIFFADEGAENVSSCLARKLAHETESLYGNEKNFIHENGKLVKDQNEHKYKEHIDTIANEKFGTGSHVFLLENLNLIPGKSVMMFHGLCDDQHPHFIHVLYLMTVNIADLDFIKMGENIDVDGIDVTKVWEKIIHKDQRGSLESRIGGCKVLIKREENLSCDL